MLQFTNSNDGVRRATLTARVSMRVDVETMAMMWLANDIAKAPPASKNALEKALTADLRKRGSRYEEALGFYWGDHVENPQENNQEYVKAQLAATITAIRYLYGIEE